MSITQPPKPPDITATTWHAIGAMYILKFLVPLRGAYLYYSVMGADPDKEGSRTEEMRAKNVWLALYEIVGGVSSTAVLLDAI